MSEINTEAEAVAALEAAFPVLMAWANDASQNLNEWNKRELMVSLWLAWLVRRGVCIDLEVVNGVSLFTAGVMTPRGLDYGDDLESPGFDSPLVAATRAFLANREEQG